MCFLYLFRVTTRSTTGTLVCFYKLESFYCSQKTLCRLPLTPPPTSPLLPTLVWASCKNQLDRRRSLWEQLPPSLLLPAAPGTRRSREDPTVKMGGKRSLLLPYLLLILISTGGFLCLYLFIFGPRESGKEVCRQFFPAQCDDLTPWLRQCDSLENMFWLNKTKVY